MLVTVVTKSPVVPADSPRQLYEYNRYVSGIPSTCPTGRSFRLHPVGGMRRCAAVCGGMLGRCTYRR